MVWRTGVQTGVRVLPGVREDILQGMKNWKKKKKKKKFREKPFVKNVRVRVSHRTPGRKGDSEVPNLSMQMLWQYCTGHNDCLVSNILSCSFARYRTALAKNRSINRSINHGIASCTFPYMKTGSLVRLISLLSWNCPTRPWYRPQQLTLCYSLPGPSHPTSTSASSTSVSLTTTRFCNTTWNERAGLLRLSCDYRSAA
jgi:hypothetical protein